MIFSKQTICGGLRNGSLDASSARARSICGISSPIALAVAILIIRSNLAGCSTGRSAGFVPANLVDIIACAAPLVRETRSEIYRTNFRKRCMVGRRAGQRRGDHGTAHCEPKEHGAGSSRTFLGLFVSNLV